MEAPRLYEYLALIFSNRLERFVTSKYRKDTIQISQKYFYKPAEICTSILTLNSHNLLLVFASNITATAEIATNNSNIVDVLDVCGSRANLVTFTEGILNGKRQFSV